MKTLQWTKEVIFNHEQILQAFFEDYPEHKNDHVIVDNLGKYQVVVVENSTGKYTFDIIIEGDWIRFQWLA